MIQPKRVIRYGNTIRFECPHAIISHVSGDKEYKIIRFIVGIDGCEHKVYGSEPTLEQAFAYLDNWEEYDTSMRKTYAPF